MVFDRTLLEDDGRQFYTPVDTSTWTVQDVIDALSRVKPENRQKPLRFLITSFGQQTGARVRLIASPYNPTFHAVPGDKCVWHTEGGDVAMCFHLASLFGVVVADYALAVAEENAIPNTPAEPAS